MVDTPHDTYMPQLWGLYENSSGMQLEILK